MQGELGSGLIRLFVSAGDPSGDLLAARLVSQIKNLSPNIEVWAIGGQQLAAVSDIFLEDIASKGIMGFLEPVRRLPYLARLARRVRTVMRERHFDLAIPVDFYGFNIRFASIAKQAGTAVIYYVCPQVWASREGRTKRLKESIDKILCLFPFEPDFLKARGISATFVGHPLVEELTQAAVSKPSNGSRAPLTLGLLPGSRPGEIQRHLGPLRSAWALIRSRRPEAGAVLYCRRGLEKYYPPAATLEKEGIRLEYGPGWAGRSKLNLALTASGLAALENMILGIPMVIFYGIKPAWVYWIGRRILRTPFIGMPNILAGSSLVPEVVWGMGRTSDKNHADKIAGEALHLLDDPKRLAEMKQSFQELSRSLAPEGKSPIHTAAEEILKYLNVGKDHAAGH